MWVFSERHGLVYWWLNIWKHLQQCTEDILIEVSWFLGLLLYKPEEIHVHVGASSTYSVDATLVETLSLFCCKFCMWELHTQSALCAYLEKSSTGCILYAFIYVYTHWFSSMFLCISRVVALVSTYLLTPAEPVWEVTTALCDNPMPLQGLNTVPQSLPVR